MDLQGFLLVGAALIGLGVWGVLSQRAILMLLLSLAQILNGILLSCVAFWHFVAPYSPQGLTLALVVLVVLAVETALGLALVVALYRARQADSVDELRNLKG